jgi:hypothetical protein
LQREGLGDRRKRNIDREIERCDRGTEPNDRQPDDAWSP